MSALKGVRDVIKSVEIILDVLRKTKGIETESKEIFIRAPENIISFSVAFDINRPSLISKKLSFSIPNIQRISLYSLVPYFPLPTFQLRGESGLVLKLEDIPKETKNLLLNIEYKISSPRFVSDLVQTNVATETATDQDAYWMHAALKHPAYLKKLYDNLEVRDIDFNVDVAIYKEIKSVVPRNVIKVLSILRELSSTTDRNRAIRLTFELLKARRRGGSKDPYEIMSQAQTLFMPHHFKRFIEVTPPFRYYDAIVGPNFYDRTLQILPKTMKVVSRTDLDLNNPAADGKMYYKKRILYDDLSKLFSI